MLNPENCRLHLWVEQFVLVYRYRQVRYVVRYGMGTLGCQCVPTICPPFGPLKWLVVQVYQYTYLIKDVRASVLRVSARTSYKCSFEVAENQNKVHWHRCSGSLTLDSALNSFRSLQLALAGFIQVVYIGRQVHTTIQHSVVRWHQHRILYYYAEELFRYICANALLCTQYYTSRISSEEQFWREKVAQAAKKGQVNLPEALP